VIDVRSFAPKVLPADWQIVPCPVPGGCAYANVNGYTVIMSVDQEDDGHDWLHVSLAHMQHLPAYKMLMEVKDLFAGRDRKAVMVFPKKEEHVNIHPNCLHMFVRLDGDSLPDFTRGQGQL